MLALAESSCLSLAFLRYLPSVLKARIATSVSWAETHNCWCLADSHESEDMISILESWGARRNAWRLADVDAPAEVKIGFVVGA
jgi:hypothetical protein